MSTYSPVHARSVPAWRRTAYSSGESWAPVAVPASVLLPAFAQYVGAGHLLIGYVLLGVILARRPELTGARD